MSSLTASINLLCDLPSAWQLHIQYPLFNISTLPPLHHISLASLTFSPNCLNSAVPLIHSSNPVPFWLNPSENLQSIFNSASSLPKIIAVNPWNLSICPCCYPSGTNHPWLVSTLPTLSSSLWMVDTRYLNSCIFSIKSVSLVSITFITISLKKKNLDLSEQCQTHHRLFM